MMMIFLMNREVQIGETLIDDKDIGMIRCEVMNAFLRDRAGRNDTTFNNDFFTGIILLQSSKEYYVKIFSTVSDFESDAHRDMKKTMELDLQANTNDADSYVEKESKANDYKYIISSQEHMRRKDEDMEYYEEHVKMLKKSMIEADGANNYDIKKIEVEGEEYMIFSSGHMGTGEKEEKTEYYKEHGEMYVNDNMLLDLDALFWKQYSVEAGIDKVFLNCYAFVLMK